MKKLIQTEKCSIIYDENKEEIFRCPRELDEKDLPYFVNKERILLCPFEPHVKADMDIPFINDYEQFKELDKVPGKKLKGYFRLYFRNGWYSKWFSHSESPDEYDCAGAYEIVKWFSDNFKGGCDYYMKDFFKTVFSSIIENRYLIKPYVSEVYKIVVDMTYGNEDYPIRIYVYENLK